MKRKKFLAVMTATGLSASMLFGTVPVMAASVTPKNGVTDTDVTAAKIQDALEGIALNSTMWDDTDDQVEKVKEWSTQAIANAIGLTYPEVAQNLTAAADNGAVDITYGSYTFKVDEGAADTANDKTEAAQKKADDADAAVRPVKSAEADDSTKDNYSVALKALVDNNVKIYDDDTEADAARRLQTGLGLDYTVHPNGSFAAGSDDNHKSLDIAVKGPKGEENYTVDLKITKNASAKDKTNAEKLADLKKDLAKKLAAYNFKATGDYTQDDLKEIVENLLVSYSTAADKKSHSGEAVSITTTYDAANSTESTAETRGKVVGTVTLSFKASPANTGTEENKAKYTGEDATSVTIDFTGKRVFADATLTEDMLDDVQKYARNTLKGEYAYQNNTTADIIQKRLQAYIDKKAKDANGEKWNNISVSVSGLSQVDLDTHDSTNDKNVGSFDFTITLTDGTRTLSDQVGEVGVPAALQHSDDEKLTEVDAAVADAAKNYDTNKIQKSSSTDAATKDQLKSAVVSIVNDALKTKNTEKTLKEADGWTPITTADVQIASTKLDIGDVYYDGHDYNHNTSDSGTDATQNISASVTYTPSTTKTEGTAVVTVTETLPETESKVLKSIDSGVYKYVKPISKTTNFTLTFGKLKAKATTYLKFTQSDHQ